MGLERYPITSEFMNKESFRDHHHLGIDFAMENLTPLRTIRDGVVEKVIDQSNGLGKAVFVAWEDGKTAVYGHMGRITVSEGDKVNVGDLLGFSGNTGNVVGANGGYHLHFGVLENGVYVNPEKYIPLIQEMNHRLLDVARIPNNTDIWTQAMDQFTNGLLDMGLNLIYNSPIIHYLENVVQLFFR